MLDRLAAHRGELERQVTQRTEELRHALDRAEHATAAKSDFLAVMSHEIRTPMNAVVGATDLLLETDLEEHQRDLMQTIRTSGDLLLSLINDVLDFSKIEAGKIELEQIPFDLEVELEAVLRAFEESAGKRGLSLAMALADGLDPIVVGDPVRVRQVVMNLVSNALKFTSRGGVTVRVQAVPGSASMLAIEVQDTGIGISMEAQRRLFTAFTQADSSTTRKYGGTGLGLAICKRFVELMGGTIAVRSDAGVGSSFHFTARLPAVTPEQRATFAAASGLPGRSILVISDDAAPINRLGGVLTCYLADVRWTHPANVMTAVDFGSQGQPDLAILAIEDERVPEMLATSLAEARIPLLILGGAALDTEPSVRVRRLPEHPRRSALLACLRELVEDRPVAAGRIADHAAPRVLVAEDNAVNQKVVEAMLQRLGCEVVIAQDGVQAVQQCSVASFDLVLMDYQMPSLDGPGAARAIREAEVAAGRKRVAIVALSANAGPEFQTRCREAGMDDFLTKPMRKVDLERVIDRHVNGGPPIA